MRGLSDSAPRGGPHRSQLITRTTVVDAQGADRASAKEKRKEGRG